jgi:hypothetical protein
MCCLWIGLMNPAEGQEGSRSVLCSDSHTFPPLLPSLLLCFFSNLTVRVDDQSPTPYELVQMTQRLDMYAASFGAAVAPDFKPQIVTPKH